MPRPQVTERRTTSIDYTPRGDRVIVKRLPLPEAKEGEMLLPSSQQRPLNEGTVVAFGPKVSDLSLEQHVCFLDFAGTTVEVDGIEYLSMRQEEIHGVRS